jgi:HPt (histidine-containing phosphotransfer) domain-containing protein
MNTDFLKEKKNLIAQDDFVNQKLITHSLTVPGAGFDIVGNGLDSLYKILDDIFNAPPPSKPNTANFGVKAPEAVTTVSIDLDGLNELTEGDNEYKTTIINMFLESMPESIQKMQDDLAAEDWGNFYKSAHYAKSSLSVVRVPDMHTLANTMEVNVKKRKVRNYSSIT